MSGNIHQSVIYLPTTLTLLFSILAIAWSSHHLKPISTRTLKPKVTITIMKLIFYITIEFLKAIGLTAIGIIMLTLLLDGSDQASFMSSRGLPPINGLYNALYRLPDFL